MRPIVRYALAALVVAAAVGGFVLLGRPTPALADVVKAAEKHAVVRYKITQRTEDMVNGTGRLESVAYADLKGPRFRSESRGRSLNDTIEHVSVFTTDGRKNLCLHVLTETVIDGTVTDATPEMVKKILADGRFPRREARLTRAAGDFTPATEAPASSILDNLRALERHKGVTPVKERQGGQDLLMYRLVDGATTTTLWVDGATKLPVRLEREILDHPPSIARNHWVLSDFVWTTDLRGQGPDELFGVTPPAGYTLTDDTKPRADK